MTKPKAPQLQQSKRSSRSPDAREPELPRRSTSFLSALSLASHTPLVSTPPAARHRPFVKQTSLRIRSSQEEENEEEEEEEEGFTLEHTAASPEITYDSDSSLEDLDAVIAQASPGVKRTPRPKPELKSSERQTRSQMKPSFNLSSSVQRKPFFSSLAPTQTYKFSMNNLIKQHARDTTAQAEVATATSVLSPTLSRGASDQLSFGLGTEQSLGNNSIEYQELLSRVKKEGDGDAEVEKVMQAMNRTDAFRYEMNWYAFEPAAAANGRLSNPFPTVGLKGEAKHIFQG